MSLSDNLRTACEPVWSQVVRHRFMRAMREGTLTDDVMRPFLIQDHKFLEHFLVLVANALALADSYASRLQLGLAIGAMAGSEDSFFRQGFDRLGIDDTERRDAPETAATRRFGTLMREASATGSYAAILAVVCEANWLFLDCATAPAGAEDGSLHAQWLAQFANPDVRAFVAFLRDELDRIGPAQIDLARDFFVRANQLEMEFFDALC